MATISVKTAITKELDPVAAVRELAGAIQQTAMSVVLFFVSSRYELEQLGREMEKAFSCPVVGCTTAGELVTGQGYTKNSIVAASISSELLSVHVRLLSPISSFSATDAGVVAAELKAEVKGRELDPQSMFGLLLIDGLSFMEERVTALLQTAMGKVPLVGGSAADDWHFKKTYVYFEGAFYTGAALLALFETSLPYTIFQTHHFIRSDRRFTITEADPETRTVFTIDGKRAAAVYAAALGVEEDALDEGIFSLHPFILRLGGRNYVRSLRKALPDGSLSFYSAVDSGLVLNIGTSNDIASNLEDALHESLIAVPNPKLLIGCECGHRRLEVEASGLTDRMQGVLDKLEHVGFHTYGEQVDSLHVNQTFTGVIIGDAEL